MDRIPVVARFFAHVQTGPGVHPASCTMGTGSFPGVKRPGRGADHPPPSSAEVNERVELYLYHPSGPSGLLGVPLPFKWLGLEVGSSPSVYLTDIPHIFLVPLMCATCLVHLTRLEVVSLTISVSRTTDENIYTRSPFPPLFCLFLPLWSKHCTQSSVLKSPQTMSFTWWKRPSFTPIQNNRKNYTSARIDLF
jgi:hypothetical protein